MKKKEPQFPIDVHIAQAEKAQADKDFLDASNYALGGATLTSQVLEDAANAMIANMGAPDQFIMSPLAAQAFTKFAGIDWAWKSMKWEKLKTKLPGLPDNISDEQIDEMGRAEKKLAKILYGKS